MPAYQAVSLHSWEQPVWSLSRPRGLNSTLQTGWLIFMSFGRCSRSLALPGNYPADQSTARAAPPASRPLWRFCSPGLLLGRRCCGRGGGSKTPFCCRSTSGRRSERWLPLNLFVCAPYLPLVSTRISLGVLSKKKRPRCPSRAASVVGAAYCAVGRTPAFPLYDACVAQGIRLVQICMFSIFIPFLRFCRHTSLFVGVSPRWILGCQG